MFIVLVIIGRSSGSVYAFPGPKRIIWARKCGSKATLIAGNRWAQTSKRREAMRWLSFLLGALTALAVFGGVQIGIHLRSPASQNLVPTPVSYPALNRPQPEVPRHWGPPHEYNGQQFYIVPIG
jgi:hypothetical protein